MKMIFLFAMLLYSISGFSKNCEGDTIPPNAKVVAFSTAVLDKPFIELYASDFTFQSTDNCTEKGNLRFTFFESTPVLSKIDIEHYFKENGLEASEAEYNEGLAQKWFPNFKTSSIRLFICFFGNVVDLELNVIDEQFNNSQGICKMTLNDPLNLSGPCNEIIINVSNYKGIQLDGIKVKVKSLINNTERTFEFDKMIKISSDTGLVCITLESIIPKPIGSLNTSDIKLTRDHILGIKKFKSPLSVIAADLNSDTKVTGIDLHLFKKYYFGLSNSINDSWKYIPKNFYCGIVDIDKTLIFEVTGVQLGKVSQLEGQ